MSEPQEEESRVDRKADFTDSPTASENEAMGEDALKRQADMLIVYLDDVRGDKGSAQVVRDLAERVWPSLKR